MALFRKRVLKKKREREIKEERNHQEHLAEKKLMKLGGDPGVQVLTI